MTIPVLIGLAALILLGLWAYFTAQRLNRLHIRTDAALLSLRGALDRRAAVIAVVCPHLAPLARRVEECGFDACNVSERVAAERTLMADITGTEWDRHPEIADAQARVVLAKRFYNDAVTDTRALRTRRLVRLCRLSGNAPLPTYFEVVDTA